MYVPNGASRGDADLREWQAGIEKKLEVLLRRTNDRVKIPEAAAPGSIVGVAIVSSSAPVTWPGGTRDMDMFATTYYPPASHVDNVSPIDWLTVTGEEIRPTEEGWYQASCVVDLRWASADAPGGAITPHLSGRTEGASPAYPVAQLSSSRWGIAALVSHTPKWVTPSDYWCLECQSAVASVGAISSSSVIWSICKYA